MTEGKRRTFLLPPHIDEQLQQLALPYGDMTKVVIVAINQLWREHVRLEEQSRMADASQRPAGREEGHDGYH